jgi:uncharacterized membrane protein YvbJ
MFLENCKECKKKVSNDAKFCPKCGVPAPTTKFSIEHPKCIIEDCYEYGQTHGKKFKGQCSKHYAQDINNKSIIVLLIIAVVVILISKS